MFETMKMMVSKLFNKTSMQPDKQLALFDKYDREYREITRINYTNIFANKLSSLACTNSGLIVKGNNARTEVIDKILTKEWDRIKATTSRALGGGLIALVPYTIDGEVYIDHVPQSRIVISDMRGDQITQASIKADVFEKGNDIYVRWTEYELIGNVCYIRNKATKNDTLVPIKDIPEFEGIIEEIAIPGCDRILMSIIKCPVDNRDVDSFNGVPITYGSESIIDEIYETRTQYSREFRLKKPFVAIDDLMFDNNGNLPDNGLFKRFRVNGKLESGKMFEIYDPDIQSDAYNVRIMRLYEDLEKAIGTSKGFLTDPVIAGTTATEINRASYDTFALVGDVRKQIERSFDDLKYAIDIILNYFNTVPMGESEIEIVWDKALIESSTEKFTQTAQAVSMGAVNPARLNMLVTGLTLEEAEQEIEEITQQKLENQELFIQGTGNTEEQDEDNRNNNKEEE